MAVDDWFYEFYQDHTKRHKRDDWPDVESPDGEIFYNGLRQLFVRKGVHDRDVAEQASVDLMATKLWHVADHPPALCAAATEIYKARNANGQGGNNISDRESAKLASKDCPHCFDDGLVSVVAPKPNPEEGIPPTTAAYCVCPYGRWVMANHREKSPAYFKRIPDFANVLARRSFWLAQTPELARSIAAAEASPFTPSQLIRGVLADALADAEKACRVEAAARPKPEWMGHVEPAVPIPPRPAPAPEPVAADAGDDQVDW